MPIFKLNNRLEPVLIEPFVLNTQVAMGIHRHLFAHRFYNKETKDTYIVSSIFLGNTFRFNVFEVLISNALILDENKNTEEDVIEKYGDVTSLYLAHCKYVHQFMKYNTNENIHLVQVAFLDKTVYNTWNIHDPEGNRPYMFRNDAPII